jgi:hypothetical protein
MSVQHQHAELLEIFQCLLAIFLSSIQVDLGIDSFGESAMS